VQDASLDIVGHPDYNGIAIWVGSVGGDGCGSAGLVLEGDMDILEVHGHIYAPATAVDVHLDGTGSRNIYGAIVAKQICFRNESDEAIEFEDGVLVDISGNSGLIE
jgi:hypothetical protein